MTVLCSANFDLILSAMMESLLLVFHAFCCSVLPFDPLTEGDAFHRELCVTHYAQTSQINSQEASMDSGSSGEQLCARKERECVPSVSFSYFYKCLSDGEVSAWSFIKVTVYPKV